MLDVYITVTYKIYDIIEILCNLKSSQILSFLRREKGAEIWPSPTTQPPSRNSYNSEKVNITRKRPKTFDHTTIAVRVITVIKSDNNQLSGFDNQLTGQISPLPTVLLSIGHTFQRNTHTYNFCIYTTCKYTLLQVRQSSLRFPSLVSSSFALFRSHTLRFCGFFFFRYFFFSRTVK